MQNIIEAKKVTKIFKTYETAGTGIVASLRRKYYFRKALDSVTFSVKKGSITALLGRNGSGKSTLIKILTGILYPDSGSVNVMGFDPWKEHMKLARDIGVVLGAHGQLYWNLPAIDTFEYMRHIYGIEVGAFKERLDYLIEMLKLKEVYKKPVREMSLGEQMKCNFVASILHMPKVVFLDESTIGVDLLSKAALMETIRLMQKEQHTTFIITTHIVEDIAIAERILLLDRGRLMFNSSRSKLEHMFGNRRIVDLKFSNSAVPKLEDYGIVLVQEGNFAKLEVKTSILKDPEFVKMLSSRRIIDYKIKEPGLGSVLSKFYTRLDKKR